MTCKIVYSSNYSVSEYSPVCDIFALPGQHIRKDLFLHARLTCSDSIPMELTKAEVCQVNPLCTLLWGPHSSVTSHVDNNSKQERNGNPIFKSRPWCTAFHPVQSQAGMSTKASWWAQRWWRCGRWSCPTSCHKTPLYLAWQRGVYILDGPSGGRWLVRGCRHKAVGVWCEHIGSEKDVQAKTGGVVGLECDFFFLWGCLFTDRRYFLSAEPVYFFLRKIRFRGLLQASLAF